MGVVPPCLCGVYLGEKSETTVELEGLFEGNGRYTMGVFFLPNLYSVLTYPTSYLCIIQARTCLLLEGSFKSHHVRCAPKLAK